MVAVGGTPEMSSSTDDELSAVVDAFGMYREQDCSDALYTRVINDHLLPNLIRVELNFQGYGHRYAERPRTDGGDVHESRMIGHCATAARPRPDGASRPVRPHLLGGQRPTGVVVAISTGCRRSRRSPTPRRRPRCKSQHPCDGRRSQPVVRISFGANTVRVTCAKFSTEPEF